jgi:hypothetical protein
MFSLLTQFPSSSFSAQLHSPIFIYWHKSAFSSVFPNSDGSISAAIANAQLTTTN